MMETLESSRMCRLCGQHSGICINIFDKNENHVKKINAVLPILVHEMDLLPKQMCHRCSYKLEEFHKFYTDCLKTDMNLKSQLSWMRKREVKEHIRVPMVQIENVKIKTEPPDYDIYELDPIVENVNYINSMSSMTFPMNSVRNNNEVNSRRINDVDQRSKCNNRFHECSQCKYNHDKNNSTNQTAASSIKRTNIKSIHDLIRDSNSTDLGCSSRLNHAFENSHGTGISNDTHKAKKRLSKEVDALNIGNILTTNEVKEIKVKTEKPDDIEIRSLRPRKKSVDYIGTKRKKSNYIVNPTNISKGVDGKRRSIAKQAPSSIVNGIVIEKIKEEPVEEVQSRILRPRKYLIDYLGLKRKPQSCASNDSRNESKSREVQRKRHKSSSASVKRFTGLISNQDEFKVKQEIISDEETANIEENDETRCNGISENLVANLGNLFEQKTELAIKVEENIEDQFTTRDWEDDAATIRGNRGSKSLTKITTSQLRSRKSATKRIPDTNCSPKYLRSHDLRLRNGKVKKSQSNQQLSLGSLKKRFLELATGKSTMDRGLPAQIKENVALIKVSTSLKTPSNIKHFCEKCCVTFMNKELYMLHACYNE